MKQFLITVLFAVCSLNAFADQVELRELDKIEIVVNDTKKSFYGTFQVLYKGKSIYSFYTDSEKFSVEDANRAEVNFSNQIDNAQHAQGILVLDADLAPNDEDFLTVI